MRTEARHLGPAPPLGFRIPGRLPRGNARRAHNIGRADGREARVIIGLGATSGV